MTRSISLLVAVALLASAAFACQPDWYNQCKNNGDCCSGNCDNNNGQWADGVCKPGNGGGDPGDGSGGGDANSITYDQFSRACTGPGYPAPSQEVYNSFKAGLRHGQITTKMEAAMALAQFLWESDGLRAKREYACAQSQCPNDYRTPGCDHPNQYYFGRGYIQLSWCYNYRAAQEHLGLGNKLVEDPDSVAREEQLAWNTAFSFWAREVHNKPGVQQGQFGATTKAINGGIECSWAGHPTPPKRFNIYSHVHSVFGAGGSPNPAGCA